MTKRTVCQATDEQDGRTYFCTLSPGHRDDHEAGAGNGVVARRWPRGVLEPTTPAPREVAHA